MSATGGFLEQHWDEITTLTLEHLWLTGVAMLFATVISVPLGILLARKRGLARPVLGVVNTLQTIPSLAMFGFLLPLPFIGERAARIAIVALVAYALLPIVRNTYAGISGVDATVMDVAHAVGMTGLAAIAEGGAAAGDAVHPGRAAHGDGDVRGHRNDCRSRGCGRPGRVYLSRRGLGG